MLPSAFDGQRPLSANFMLPVPEASSRRGYLFGEVGAGKASRRRDGSSAGDERSLRATGSELTRRAIEVTS